MGNLSNVKYSDTLPDFQTFLLAKKLVPEKHASFYAYRAGKYFNFALKKEIPSDLYNENAVFAGSSLQLELNNCLR